ncbi:MAG: hypothetical protein ACRD50_03830 [Candidatus Acidiferrales bacterium]
MNLAPRIIHAVVALFLVVPFSGSTALAAALDVPPEAKQGLEKLYSGDPGAAIELFRAIQKSQPDQPLGYLLEADARWWKMYCAASEVKWGMVDAWKRGKGPGDDEYLALASRGIALAEMQLQSSETAEMHFYAGLGYALQARLFGLRDEKRAAARVGVKARSHFLRATQLDPNLADAYTGLGLYNYYVDTLSPIIKMLRFFMGIPGGNKNEGIRQLETAMNHGVLTAVEARFYLAKNFRTYDREYARGEALMAPLVRDYPKNGAFLLLLGNLNAELGRKEKATTYFRAAENLSFADPACEARVRAIAAAFLGSAH